MKSLYNIPIFFTIFFMATLAQIQAEATAKRAANATPTLSQSLNNDPSFDKAAYDAERVAFVKSQNYVATPQVQSGPARVSAGYNTDGTFYSTITNKDGTVRQFGSKTTTPESIAPIKVSSNIPVDTINGVKKTYIARPNTKLFTESIGKARSRTDYNTGINYDTLDKQSKKIADRYYTAAEKAGKLLPPKDMYENREDTITSEKKKEEAYYDTEIGRQKKAEEDALAAENLFIDTQTSDITNERDTFIGEQEAIAKDTESNRLNQVRGNIMQVLAARGIDISKLSPEQIVALSGEQGAKAFMDITEVREKTKANIKQARDTTLARLNDLRQRKAISTSAYEKNVANINSQAEAAKLNADKNASSQIFALTQTKTEQGRTDSTQRANAVTNIASMLGLSGSQIAPVLNLINTKGTGPEQLVEIAKLIADKNSDLRKSLDANMTASQQAALQKQLLDTYKAETARITATRARSSGSGGSSTETVQI